MNSAFSDRRLCLTSPKVLVNLKTRGSMKNMLTCWAKVTMKLYETVPNGSKLKCEAYLFARLCVHIRWAPNSLKNVSTCIDWNDGSTKKLFRNSNLTRPSAMTFGPNQVWWMVVANSRSYVGNGFETGFNLFIMFFRNNVKGWLHPRSFSWDVLAAAHFSANPGGKDLSLSIRLWMALYWRRRSLSGIWSGLVRDCTATFCSSVKVFTRFARLSPPSPVLKWFKRYSVWFPTKKYHVYCFLMKLSNQFPCLFNEFLNYHTDTKDQDSIDRYTAWGPTTEAAATWPG